MVFEVEEDHQGYFGVCIFRAENTEDNEIQEIFRRFGPITRFNRTNHLVFVSYKRKEEAVNCLASMMNDKRYVVKPAKPKSSSRDSMENSRKYNFKSNDGGELQKRSNYKSSGSEDIYASGSLPELVPILPPTDDEDLPKAVDVLIGNLPAKMSQRNVYDLCIRAKCTPIHVEMRTINRPPVPKLYYAQVFFKTEIEAKDIMLSLNKLVINKHQLVVRLVE